jgi:hypothetical protein
MGASTRRHPRPYGQNSSGPRVGGLSCGGGGVCSSPVANFFFRLWCALNLICGIGLVLASLVLTWDALGCNTAALAPDLLVALLLFGFSCLFLLWLPSIVRLCRYGFLRFLHFCLVRCRLLVLLEYYLRALWLFSGPGALWLFHGSTPVPDRLPPTSQWTSGDTSVSEGLSASSMCLAGQTIPYPSCPSVVIDVSPSDPLCPSVVLDIRPSDPLCPSVVMDIRPPTSAPLPPPPPSSHYCTSSTSGCTPVSSSPPGAASFGAAFPSNNRIEKFLSCLRGHFIVGGAMDARPQGHRRRGNLPLCFY